MADLITDIDSAYATQVNPIMGYNNHHTGGSSGGLLPPPAVQTNDPVVILPTMSSTPTTTPTYPETVVVDAIKSQHAAANHDHQQVVKPPFVESMDLEPPSLDEEPGYLERLGLRTRDVIRLIILALMVALGISIHWIGSHYITEWLDSSDFNAKQRLAIRLLYPVIIVLVMWNIKAFQP
ncbi:hypothetical protein TetV_041 [Tetraselmis virus 1]|uniref:Uncharacterized protein n=1 Tax=Tetraselmis virus 1 TaxID=2060617 RepID=A0A2P0VMM4_9VIRU|nr:hypothetical protein QJ968_gp041 [Tetraselmis virus 1]AUF82133.1 hypothetical protein TetV_041 [Tetraselmis virus 1]